MVDVTDIPLDTWQYKISQLPERNAINTGQLFVRVGPGIEAIKLADQAGKRVGLLLGFPIDLDSEMVLHVEHHFSFLYDGDPDRFSKNVFAALGGPFLFILDVDDVVRIYSDSGAQVPCVFDRELKIAASTSHAMFDEETYWARFDSDLFNRLNVVREGWFPGGLTAHRGVERLLPNFYLDIATWTVRRHFPLAELVRTESPDDAVEEFIALVRKQISALLKEPERVAQALTAGQETRSLLAISRPFVDQIDFVTVTGHDRHAVDTIMARRISTDMNLRHRELQRVKATKDQTEIFFRRGGHSVGDSNAVYHPSVWPIAASHNFVGGVGGEIGRAFFWRQGDTDTTRISPKQLILRMGLATDPRVQDFIGEWMKSLAGIPMLDILDLAYAENRVAPWASAQFFSDPGLVRFAPLLTQRNVEILLSLPTDWRRSGRLFPEIIRQSWPELQRYPYNSLGIVWDSYAKVLRLVQNPSTLAKKIRKQRG